MQTDLRRISRLIGNLTRSTTINLPRGVTISIISRRDPIDSVLHERLLVAAFDSSSINNAKITIFIERGLYSCDYRRSNRANGINPLSENFEFSFDTTFYVK